MTLKKAVFAQKHAIFFCTSSSLTKKIWSPSPKDLLHLLSKSYQTIKILTQRNFYIKESLLMQLCAGVYICTLKLFRIVDRANWNQWKRCHLNRLYFKTSIEVTHLISFKIILLYPSATIKQTSRMNAIYIDFLAIPHCR